MVREYGPARVYEAGIEALKYPPHWIESSDEAVRVVRRLLKKGN